MVEIGVTSWSLPVRGIDAPACAALLGFRHLHLDFDDIFDLADARGLRRAAERAKISLAALSVSSLERHGFSDSAAERAADIANALGIEMLYFPCFGKADLRHTGSHAAISESVGRSLQRFKGTVAIESLATAAGYRALFGVVDPRARILHDTQNPYMAGFSAADLANEIFDLLARDVHVKDGIGTLGNAHIGEGNAQVEDSLNVLLRRKYSGRLTLENNYARYLELDPARDIAMLRSSCASRPGSQPSTRKTRGCA